MTKKKTSFKIWNLKAFILAFQVAFTVCFFIGIFSKSVRISLFNDTHWYYINRGYPISWAGVSRVDRIVDFPIIKAPLLAQGTFVKIIDLSIFTPFIFSMQLLFYPIELIWVRATAENKSLSFFINSSFVLLTLTCIFFYFFWFTRI